MNDMIKMRSKSIFIYISHMNIFFSKIAATGESFHGFVQSILTTFSSEEVVTGIIGDVPTYALVGAASTLAALYRAPLTSSLLVFELTRDCEVILPLLVSAGFASLVGDVVDDYFEKEKKRRRNEDGVSWGDLADERD